MSKGRAPRKYPRTARVNEVVREVLAEEIERLSDPRLGFITLTDVEVSRDLRHANVYYSALGRKGAQQTEEEVDATAAALGVVDPTPSLGAEPGGSPQVPS